VPKILSQSGTSLADTYDIEGSIAGVENLESESVHLVDALGGRVHSERLNAFVLNVASDTNAQNAAFATEAVVLPDCVNRILGIIAFVRVTARVAHCTVNIRLAGTGGEFPIWSWDDALDDEYSIRLSESGAAVSTVIALRPSAQLQPFQQIVMRSGDEQTMPSFFLRGLTNGFGAGTVNINALIYIARPQVATVTPGTASSHGLPIPSW